MTRFLDVLSNFQNTPVPAILVIAGIMLLLLSFVDQIGTVITLPSSRRTTATITGLLFLSCGIMLFIIPALYPPGPPPKPPIDGPPIKILDKDSNKINGRWVCNTKSQYHITWLITIADKDGVINAEGCKSFVDGKEADQLERATCWRLNGQITSLKSLGTYYEEGPSGRNNGTYEITFSDDTISFSGFLLNPTGTKVASVQGSKIQ